MSSQELAKVLDDPAQYKEVWTVLPDGQRICLLLNGDRGWLMYLRDADGDCGFSSRNPGCNEDGKIDYILENGQWDEYPARWAYTLPALSEALQEFLQTRRIPSRVSWHDDSLHDKK